MEKEDNVFLSLALKERKFKPKKRHALVLSDVLDELAHLHRKARAELN